MKTLELIRAGLRIILFFSITSLIIMGAGITDTRGNLGDQLLLMGAFALMTFSSWYLHGVIDAMYHAEKQREFFRRQ